MGAKQTSSRPADISVFDPSRTREAQDLSQRKLIIEPHFAGRYFLT